MTQVGNIVTKHELKSSYIVGQLFSVIMLIGVGFVATYLLNFTDYLEFIYEALEEGFGNEFTHLLGLVPIVIGLVLLIPGYLFQVKEVVIYDDGIGTKKKQWDWDQITGFTETETRRYLFGVIPISKNSQFYLRFSTGDKFILDNKYKDFKLLSTTLRGEIGNRINKNDIQEF